MKKKVIIVVVIGLLILAFYPFIFYHTLDIEEIDLETNHFERLTEHFNTVKHYRDFAIKTKEEGGIIFLYKSEDDIEKLRKESMIYMNYIYVYDTPEFYLEEFKKGIEFYANNYKELDDPYLYVISSWFYIIGTDGENYYSCDEYYSPQMVNYFDEIVEISSTLQKVYENDIDYFEYKDSNYFKLYSWAVYHECRYILEITYESDYERQCE